jgi:hypothetical protein
LTVKFSHREKLRSMTLSFASEARSLLDRPRWQANAPSASELPSGAFYAALFTFAHRARCAVAILLRPAAEIVRFGLGA